MKRILSLVIVASMLLSLVAVVPMNVSAAEDKKSTDVEAYYFGGEAIFIDHEGAATKLEVVQEVSIKENADASKGTIVLDGTIDEGEWGSPEVFVDSNYAASNDGLTGRTNAAYEEASAENTYFYYKKDSYLTPSGSYYPWEKGMNYSLYFMWDEEYFYIAADVYDASGHSSDAANKDAWDADTFQFRIDKDGPNGVDEGYKADGGLDADGNKIVNMPWRSSVYASGGEITSEVPNFIVTRTSADGGYTLVRDNANRYFPHDEEVPSADDPNVLVTETRYADTELSFFLESFEYPIVDTYEDFKAESYRARIPEFVENGAVYATAVAHKVEKKVMQTQYEIAVPWGYIDDAEDFMAEIGDVFGISTMVVDRQNSKAGSFGAFLEWGTGINASHRPNYDPATCLGSNALTLSATSYDEHVACDHDFAAATCEAPETCTLCGYQRGFKTGHEYELVNYKLPTTKAAGYANAVCSTCNEPFNNTLAQAGDSVYKKFNRNDGLVDLTKALSSSFAAVWTQMKWSKNAEGNWENEAGATVYNVDGENSGKNKDMLWLAGQTRPEIKSADHVEATGIKNPYDFTVLDFTCFSETASYFEMYDFSSKNSTVTMKLDIWNRLEGKDREMEGESGYHDTVAFWFGPNAIEYLAGLFIVEDKDAAGVVTDTKYYFAITPNNSSALSSAAFEEAALAYTEIDPSVLNIGQGSWNDMTFFVDYDANVALLFWDGELVVGEYDPHFTTTKNTINPILRVFNIEMCVTDLYAGQAGLAADYVTPQGGEGAPEEPETTEPIPETTEPEPETTEPEPETTEPEPETTEPEPETTEPEPEETEPEAALGSYENPYLLNANDMVPLRVTVAPGETAYIKTSDINGVVTAGFATHSEYMLVYGRQVIYPTGTDNAASFSLMGYDVFSVYNMSETDNVMVALMFEGGQAGSDVGTKDNPEVLEFVQGWFGAPAAEALADLAAGNEGYYYKVVAPAKGKVNVGVSAYDADYMSLGWIFCVNNLTKGIYGDNIIFNNDPDAFAEGVSVEVEEGDELEIFVATFDAANPFSAPAGTVNMSASFEAVGTEGNPAPVEPGDYTAVVGESSQGYYYEYVVTEDGKLTVTMNSADNWQFAVNKSPADIEDYGNYYYGDVHAFVDGVASETIDVKAGDKVKIMVNTYNVDEPWACPAGSVEWTLGFEAKEVFNGDGLLYTLTGEVIDDQLIVTVDISDNNEGIYYAGLDFVYNTEALTFAEATTYDEVFETIEYSNHVDLSKLQLLAYMTGMDNSYTDGKMITVVFDIVDESADYGIDLDLSANDPANHICVDGALIEYEVEFTFELGEIKPPVIPMADINVTGEAIDNQLHVYVDLANNPGIWALGFDLSYNSAVLELVDTIYGDVFGEGEVLSSTDALGFTFFGNNEDSVKENITEDGRLVELVFNVLDYSAEAYEYGIDFTYDFGNVINAKGKEVILNVEIGEIEKVEEPVYILGMNVTGEGIDNQLHVYVDVTENPGIWSLGFTVEYNAEALKLVDTIYGDVFGEGEALTNGSIFFGNNNAVDSNNTATGRIVELVFDVVDYDADYGINLTYVPGNIIDNAGNEVDVEVTIGTIEKLEKPAPTTAIVTINGVETEYEIGATVTLHAATFLKDGDKYYAFAGWTAEGVELADVTAQDVEFVVTGDATVTTVRYLHGDANEDGEIDGLDATRVKQVILGTRTDYNATVINVNLGADGEIDGLDYSAVKQVILGIFNYTRYEVAEVEVH